MSDLFNSNVRDYCGNESAISKISNHFSKDYAMRQDGINQNVKPVFNQPIPTSFNLNELFKNATLNEKQTSHVDLHLPINEVASNNREATNLNSNASSFCEQPIFSNNASFISPTYFNIPQPLFTAPDHSSLAREWARNELSQFDNSIITEADFTALSMKEDRNESNLRFSDVVRHMAIEDEQKEIDIYNVEMKQANNDFLYDLDQDLKRMRDKIASNEDSVEMWQKMNGTMDEVPKEFMFITDNQYAESLRNEKENQTEKIDEMLNKGIKLYQEGYFSEAVLMFEAVVQTKMDSEKGWHYLALSLSEHEQDLRAAVACQKCLDLNKDNQEILLSLARIYCNEMSIPRTIGCIERWLLSNPRYTDLATVGQEAIHSIIDESESMWENIFEEAFESSGQFGIIEQQLKSAQERNGSSIDPDLEIALGTLYHVIQNYSKSTTHFENATKVSSNNALLWNKLGTSYCNSGEYDKAIDAYRRALELAPGFVRAQCNLGVSNYNMGNYREAIKHALRARKLQHSVTSSATQTYHAGQVANEAGVINDPIWTLIRMSCFKLDRPDLDLVIFSGDVDTLNKEFDA